MPNGAQALMQTLADAGSIAVAAAHGITLVSRSRQMTRVDLYDHHHVLVADRPVLAKIRSLTGSAFGEIGGPGKAGARVRLLAAFETVNGHFQRLFTTLFDGGQAHLELIDSDDAAGT